MMTDQTSADGFAAVAPTDPRVGKIAVGRYRIDALIAKGGVGIVYRAHDTSTGRDIALKRLLPEAADDTRNAMFFRREYETLARIRHPKIIEVFDYGVDEEGPYYTMELLRGKDLDELAPVAYRDACRLLRDVASSLALLHSRRLLHRDLSPHNVRLTDKGRCKLLDFGTMATFGAAEEIVGTPPLISPESLRGAALDQRSDLYSLGALAYRILTQRYAYRATQIEDLPPLWQVRPPLPSEIAPDIPPALDELVMQLLSLDPLLRPTAATEVIERLTVIGGLEPETEAVEAAQAYLTGSRLIGRTRQLDRIKRRLQQAEGGAGATLLIEGNPGVGKSRLLDEAALLAQLAGALVLRVEARTHREPLGAAAALCRALLHALPGTAQRLAEPYADVLGHAIPALREHASEELTRLQTRQQQTRMQEAMLHWFLDVSREHLVVVLIDDLHTADAPSSALVAALTHEAPRHRLLVIGTRRLAGLSAAPKTLGVIADNARRLRIHRLRREDTAALIDSLFGDVPHAVSLAQWMHDVTTGSPLQIMSLSQHLVDTGVIRYVGGLWVLPPAISSATLPSNLAATLSARLAALAPSARHFAEALSLRRGALPLWLCVALHDELDEQKAFALLDELVNRGVLVSSSAGFAFGQEALRDVLVAELTPERTRELHERVAAALLSAQPLTLEDEIEAGWHLLSSGAEKRGAALLAAAAPRLAYRGDATSAALPAIEAALQVYEKHGRPPEECLPLRIMLVRSLDRGLCQKYGDSTLEQLAEYAGLNTARSLQPVCGKWLALRLGVVSAGVRHAATPRTRRGPPPVTAIRGIYACSLGLLPMHSAILDVEGVARIAAITEVLAPGSITSEFIHLHVSGSLAGLQGRYHEARKKLDRASTILEENPSLPQTDSATRRAFRVATLVVRGVLDAHYALSGERTRATIAALESIANDDPATPTPDGVPIEAFITNVEVRGLVAQLRLVLHTLHGEQAEAQVHRDRFALLGIQTGLAWVYDIWRTLLESVAGARSGDVTSLRRAIEQLRREVPDLPGLQKYLLLDEGYLELTLGRPAEARAIFERCCDEFPLGEIVGWDNTRNSLGQALIAVGEHARACEVIEEALPYTGTAEEPTVVRVLMECTQASARAHLGHHEDAAARIEGLLRRIANSDHPMLLGHVHETAARIAELAGDEDRHDEHLAAMQRWWGETHNPALLTRAQRARVRHEPSERSSALEATDIEVATRVSTLRSARGVLAILDDCQDEEQRARSALHMIAEEAAGSSGYLFRWSRGELRLLASLGAGAPQDELERAIRRQIRHILGDGSQAEHTPETTLTTVGGGEADGEQQYATVLLTRSQGDTRRVVAAVALRVGSVALRPLPARQLQTIAEALDDGSPAGSLPPPTEPPTAPS